MLRMLRMLRIYSATSASPLKAHSSLYICIYIHTYLPPKLWFCKIPPTHLRVGCKSMSQPQQQTPPSWW